MKNVKCELSMNFMNGLIFFSISITILASQIAKCLYFFIPPNIIDDDYGIFWAVYLREAGYFSLFIASCIFFSKKISTAYVPWVMISLLLIYSLKDAILLSDLQLLPFGVRVFILLFSFYSVFVFCGKSESCGKIRIIFYIIKVILIIYVAASVYQMLSFPGTFGQTIFGARANGPYQNPINFSIAIAAFSVAFYYSEETNRKYWILLCLVLTFTTGGRAGILVTILVTIMTFVVGRLGYKFSVVAIILLPIFFQLISSSAISGRDEANESGLKDGRLAQWTEIVNPIISSGAVPVLLGAGLGEGTNASISYHKDTKTIVSDSAFVMMFRSFGLIGLAFYLLSLIVILNKYKLNSIVLLCATFIFSMAQSLPEQHPAFLILIFSLGLLERKTLDS